MARSSPEAQRPRLWPYIVGAVALWTLAVAGMYAWHAANSRDVALQLALRQARANFDKDLAFRLWATSHGGIYVPVDEQTPPNPGLAHVPERDIQTPSGRKLTLMNPAYMVRQMNEHYADLIGVESRITSLKPLRAGNAPDSWERAALKRFEAGESEVLEVTERNGAPALRYMKAMVTEQGCLKCHAFQGYRVGDVRGGVSVAVPLAPYLEQQRRGMRDVSFSYFGIWLLGLFGIGVGGRGLVRQGQARQRYEAGLSRAKEELEAANALLAAEAAERERLAREVGQILRFTGEGILAVDPQGLITQANPAAEQLLGYEAGELTGMHCSRLSCMEADPIARTLAQGTVQHMGDGCFRRRDESPMRVQLVATPMREEGRVTGAVLSFKDVTLEREAAYATGRLTRALSTLSQCNEALVRAESVDELLQAVCRVIVETGGYVVAWVGFAEEDPGRTIRPVAVAGMPLERILRDTISWDAAVPTGRGPSGQAMRSRQAQVIRNVHTDPAYEAWRASFDDYPFGSALVLPLLRNGDAFGVLNVYARETGAFDSEEVRLLGELANDLAYGIRMHQTARDRDVAQQALDKVLLQTIEAISLTVEKRDPYTAGHQQRVGELAAAVGERMGLDPQRIQGLRLGAIIHDIGKIYVPAEILNRPGRLSPVEFNLIKSHPQVGFEIIQGVDFPWPVRAMILQHHERLDGSGYPKGLKGEEILLEARILAVADVVEAINAHRPYRPAMGIHEALAEIRRGCGTLYDPVVVDACLALFEQGHFRWRS